MSLSQKIYLLLFFFLIISYRGNCHEISYNDNFPGRLALTFDDGPDPYYTPVILDILRKNNIKGTFFVTGINASLYPDIIRKIAEEGHTLGNHTYSHINMRTRSDYNILEELQMTQELVDRALGYHYKLGQIRPPYGEYDYSIYTLLSHYGQIPVLWQIDSQDWMGYGDYYVLDNLYRQCYRGGVILLHDIYPAAGHILQEFIDHMQYKGFKFITVEDLLYQKYNLAIEKPLKNSPVKKYTVIDKYDISSMYFNNKPLGENGKVRENKQYISVKFFFNHLGLDYGWDDSKKELTFCGNKYKCPVIDGKAFISTEILIREFSLRIRDKKTDFFYPSICLNGISLKKEAFFYHGELYFILRDVENITGIKFKWKSDMEIYTGNKQIKGKTFCGTTYLPLSSLYETGLVEIELKKDNDINIKLIKFIINNDFSPLKSYRDGENNEIKVSIEDISKILNLWTKDLKITGSYDGPYIALSSVKAINGVTVSYEPQNYMIKISAVVKGEE
ncbi:MAG: polysaccharide deacetylase family protein [Candidatus Eremiobacterota bacterium]